MLTKNFLNSKIRTVEKTNGHCSGSVQCLKSPLKILINLHTALINRFSEC